METYTCAFIHFTGASRFKGPFNFEVQSMVLTLKASSLRENNTHGLKIFVNLKVKDLLLALSRKDDSKPTCKLMISRALGLTASVCWSPRRSPRSCTPATGSSPEVRGSAFPTPGRVNKVDKAQ